MGNSNKDEITQPIVYSITGLDLLRSVGNELKLPLMQISNAASLLNYDKLNERERAMQLEQLEMSARHMLHIIDSVLFAGQIETQQTMLQLEPTNVSSVVHNVMGECRELAQKYKKRLKLRITQELSPAAVDPVALNHSLFGLLDMLIRSADSDEIEVLIHHQANAIMITLRDNGPAVSVQQIKTAFKRLGKATQPLKALPNTTGMAFYVAYSLTRAMGGDVSVKRSGDERRLSLTLPLSQQLELI